MVEPSHADRRTTRSTRPSDHRSRGGRGRVAIAVFAIDLKLELAVALALAARLHTRYPSASDFHVCFHTALFKIKVSLNFHDYYYGTLYCWMSLVDYDFCDGTAAVRQPLGLLLVMI